MAKRPKTSITDLVKKKTSKPSLDEINAIADKIHSPTPPPAKPKPAPKRKPKKAEPKNDLSGRTKRISLNAPLELYLDIQRESTLQGKPMMQYILEVVRKDIERKK